jgi:hypothetical protein
MCCPEAWTPQQLAQGTSARLCLVQMERYDELLPEVKVFRPPTFAGREDAADTGERALNGK